MTDLEECFLELEQIFWASLGEKVYHRHHVLLLFTHKCSVVI